MNRPSVDWGLLLYGERDTARAVFLVGMGLTILFTGARLAFMTIDARLVASATLYVLLGAVIILAIVGGYLTAGLYASVSGLFVSGLAFFVGGPIVGILIGSTSPTFATYHHTLAVRPPIDPWRELATGVGPGIFVGLFLAWVVGIPAFVVGAGGRRLVENMR